MDGGRSSWPLPLCWPPPSPEQSLAGWNAKPAEEAQS